MTKGWEPALHLIELCTLGLVSSDQSVQIPLQSFPALQQIYSAIHLSVVLELTEYLLVLIKTEIYMSEAGGCSWDGRNASVFHLLSSAPLPHQASE